MIVENPPICVFCPTMGRAYASESSFLKKIILGRDDFGCHFETGQTECLGGLAKYVIASRSGPSGAQGVPCGVSQSPGYTLDYRLLKRKPTQGKLGVQC